MAYIVAQKFGIELLEALGVDPSAVSSLVLRCDVGGFPTLEVTHIIAEPLADGIVEIVKTYELTPKVGDEV